MYNLNNIVYFVSNNVVIKGVIDERIVHETQKEPIIKYVVRPYGMKEYITLDPAKHKVYATFEDAKENTIKHVKEVYKKETIDSFYENHRKNLEVEYQKTLKSSEENLNISLKVLKERTESFYDEKEREYQEKIKENTNESK